MGSFITTLHPPMYSLSMYTSPSSRVTMARQSVSVRYGDNLSTIAYRLGTSVNHLVATNGLRNANLIYPGQVLSY